MSVKLAKAKIALPYARALFKFSIEKNLMHQITADFHNLNDLLKNSNELVEYLTNPVITNTSKKSVLFKLLKLQINLETLNFLMFLIEQNRINLLQIIIDKYLKLVFKTATIKAVEIFTPINFTESQKFELNKKLKKLINARELQLSFIIDETLIGGFLVKTESQIIDFTIKNQLKQLAKHLNVTLKI